MIRGTTPDIRITIKNPGDLDLTTALSVYVTIWQNGRSVTKTGDQVVVNAASVEFDLTQQESLGFCEGAAEAQINWTYQGSDRVKRGATKWTEITIGRQLLEKVV